MSWNPTLNASETGRDVRAFVKRFQSVFWRFFKPLLPWIIAGYALDAALSAYLETEKTLGIGSLIAAYFMSTLAISWHRVMIDGPDHAVPMNPFKPQRHELAFIGVAVAFGAILFLSAMVVGALGALIGPAATIVGAIIIVLAALYIIVRLSIYFPAKAVNRSITLKEAYALTHGLVWKMMWAPLVATWRLLLGLFAYSIVAIAILALLAMQYPEGTSIPLMWQYVWGFTYGLPMIVYFEPLLYVLGVGCLSNYYLYAIQRQIISGQDFSADNQ